MTINQIIYFFKVDRKFNALDHKVNALDHKTIALEALVKSNHNIIRALGKDIHISEEVINIYLSKSIHWPHYVVFCVNLFLFSKFEGHRWHISPCCTWWFWLEKASWLHWQSSHSPSKSHASQFHGGYRRWSSFCWCNRDNYYFQNLELEIFFSYCN